MAIIYKATVIPSKLDLLQGYMPKIPGLADYLHDKLTQVGAYRFDDPEGHVGIETIVLSTPDGSLIQFPVTYRNESLPGAEQWLLGTTEHSILGTRWVYAGYGDPVYVGELVHTMTTGGTEVAEMVETEDGPVGRQPTINVMGSAGAGPGVPSDRLDPSIIGTDVHIRLGDSTLELRLVVDPQEQPTGSLHLTGKWEASPEPKVLAVLN